MKYTVVWLKAAQDHLAQIWLEGPDRQEITAAANATDAQLRFDPYRFSESRIDNQRVLFYPPLGIAFEVSDPDCLVSVYAVWRGKP